MQVTNHKSILFKKDIHTSIQRLTTIWALSEAAFGGVLHAFKVPLTGIFINGIAVIIISLISYMSNKKGQILKATLIVILVKAAVSPHTPLNAYLAVSLQGIIGELIFSSKKYFKMSALAFGIITLSLSGFQRIIVLTILFGKNLWDSIDLFGNYIINQLQFYSDKIVTYEVSNWLIIIYIGVHLLVGLIVGIFSGNIPNRLNKLDESNLYRLRHDIKNESINDFKKHKSKFWLRKPSSIAILFLFIFIMTLTYVFPQFSETAALKALIMVIRSFFIMIIWYVIVGPFLLKIYKNFINKHGSKYSSEVDSTIKLLPFFKSIVIFTWKNSKKYKNINRIKQFIWTTLVNILVLDLPKDE